MFPIRDENPGLSRPVLTLIMIGVLVAVFFLLTPFNLDDSPEFALRHAAIGCEVTTNQLLTLEEYQTGECSTADGTPRFPQKSVSLSVLVSLFLHAGPFHLLFNAWSLWLFGNNVEDAYGRGGYLLLYLISGIVATYGFVALNPDSTAPLVGASGAIAGVMGAYVVLYPRAKILSLAFFYLLRIPAIFFLTLWLGSQFLLAGGGSGIAWEAHVAGFLFGVVVTLLFRGPLNNRLRNLEEEAYEGSFGMAEEMGMNWAEPT